MLMNIEDENLQISISDKNFSETILEGFEYSITENGYLVDLFEVTSNIISDVKFDLFKTFIGKGVPESLQTEEYMEFMVKVFRMKKVKL